MKTDEWMRTELLNMADEYDRAAKDMDYQCGIADFAEDREHVCYFAGKKEAYQEMAARLRFLSDTADKENAPSKWANYERDIANLQITHYNALAEHYEHEKHSVTLEVYMAQMISLVYGLTFPPKDENFLQEAEERGVYHGRGEDEKSSLFIALSRALKQQQKNREDKAE